MGVEKKEGEKNTSRGYGRQALTVHQTCDP